jgi:NAD(P)-dependent dehydrogenase (short-subunit alcohol dehydrogenase family)
MRLLRWTTTSRVGAHLQREINCEGLADVTGGEVKTAVLTGAAGGIGQAVARRLAQSGYKLVLSDADGEKLGSVPADLSREGATVWAKEGDLRSKSYCENLIDTAIDATGRLDVLVNNAGIITRGNVVETTGDDWERTFDINVRAIFFTCRAAIPHMERQGGGSIVNVASCWGLYPGPGHPAYVAAKPLSRPSRSVWVGTMRRMGYA